MQNFQFANLKAKFYLANLETISKRNWKYQKE